MNGQKLVQEKKLLNDGETETVRRDGIIYI